LSRLRVAGGVADDCGCHWNRACLRRGVLPLHRKRHNQLSGDWVILWRIPDRGIIREWNLFNAGFHYIFEGRSQVDLAAGVGRARSRESLGGLLETVGCVDDFEVRDLKPALCVEIAQVGEGRDVVQPPAPWALHHPACLIFGGLQILRTMALKLDHPSP